MKEWIGGKNPVYECLRACRRHFFRLLMAEGLQVNKRIQEIINLAEKNKLVIEKTPRTALSAICDHHQGIALQTSAYPYAQLDDILSVAAKHGEKFLILLLDQIQDPQNLGTLLRSAELFGVHGILMPASRAAGVTPAVVQSSSGASESLMIAQGNIVQAIDEVKNKNGWVIGLDMDSSSQPLAQVDLSGNLALVVGGEGEGLRLLVKKKCDLLTHIPMTGTLDSLNAAVAGSIALYCASLQRREKK